MLDFPLCDPLRGVPFPENAFQRENNFSQNVEPNSWKGVNDVTVATQVKQTLASLKSAQANLETFALNTQNKAAKQAYTQAAQATQSIIDTLEQRVTELENEEPQYKGF